jgi:hypothetical protein
VLLVCGKSSCSLYYDQSYIISTSSSVYGVNTTAGASATDSTSSSGRKLSATSPPLKPPPKPQPGYCSGCVLVVVALCAGGRGGGGVRWWGRCVGFVWPGGWWVRCALRLSCLHSWHSPQPHPQPNRPARPSRLACRYKNCDKCDESGSYNVKVIFTLGLGQIAANNCCWACKTGWIVDNKCGCKKVACFPSDATVQVSQCQGLKPYQAKGYRGWPSVPLCTFTAN